MEDDDEGARGDAAPAGAALAAARRSSASASARQLGASLWEIHNVARGPRRDRPRGGRGVAAGRDREHGGGGGGGAEFDEVRVSRSLFLIIGVGRSCRQFRGLLVLLLR